MDHSAIIAGIEKELDPQWSLEIERLELNVAGDADEDMIGFAVAREIVARMEQFEE